MTMMWLLWFTVAVGVVPVWTDHSGLVTDLPGLPHQPSFKHYSEYFNVRGSRLHYWFVESQGDPVKDPVLLWLSSGPGCSSLNALLSENGPFQVIDDSNLAYNQYSWNSNANVLYLDSPAGVGYSYSFNGQFADDDDQLVEENYAALLAFYAEFTEFNSSKLYIGGSGYGGLQAILLANKTRNTEPSSIQLQGVVVGNPFLDEVIMKNSTVYYAFYHGLISERLWKLLLANCCPDGVCDFSGSSNTSAQCILVLSEFNDTVYGKGIDLYSIISYCSGGIPAHLSLTLKWPEVTSNGYTKQTCLNQTDEMDYLQRVSVREALHVSADCPLWTPCSRNVTRNFKRTVKSVTKLVSSLATDLPTTDDSFKMLIYSGDQDFLFNFLATEWSVGSMGLRASVESRPWQYNDQIVGYIKGWNDDKLSVVTFNDAGHFVGKSQPGPALEMITDFFSDVPIN